MTITADPPRFGQSRRYQRHLIDVRIAVAHGNGHPDTHGRTHDLSEGGVGALVPVDLAVGDAVELEFTLPGLEDRLMLRGVVRHRNGFRVGFEFETPSAEQRRLIRRVCASLPPSG